MDKEATITTSAGVTLAWLCNHVSDIEATIIFILTVSYLVLRIKYVYHKNEQIKRQLEEKESDEELL